MPNLLIGVGIGVVLPAVAALLWIAVGATIRATAKASAWTWIRYGKDTPQASRAKSAAVAYAARRARTFSAGNFAVVFVAGQDYDARREAEEALIVKRTLMRKSPAGGAR